MQHAASVGISLTLKYNLRLTAKFQHDMLRGCSPLPVPFEPIVYVIRNLLRYAINPKEDTRWRVMPYACGDYILTCGEITYQSFGLDRKKQVFRLAFFLAPPNALARFWTSNQARNSSLRRKCLFTLRLSRMKRSRSVWGTERMRSTTCTSFVPRSDRSLFFDADLPLPIGGRRGGKKDRKVFQGGVGGWLGMDSNQAKGYGRKLPSPRTCSARFAPVPPFGRRRMKRSRSAGKKAKQKGVLKGRFS